MMETNSERHSNASVAASYYEDCNHVDRKGAGVCKSANVGASEGGHKTGRFGIPLFFVKAFVFVSFVMLLQFCSPSMSALQTGVHTHGGPGSTAAGSHYPNKARGNRILIECLKNLNTTYETLEQNIVDKIENIYEQQRRNIASKIMAFIKKIDLILEKEIVKTLKYIDAEKDEPIKCGLNFYEKMKKFFSGLKIFSTPVLGTFAAFTAYYFKAQAFTAMLSLTVAFLPLMSTCYLMYKVFKIRSDMSK
ncbi:Plasmodium exported protein, unknown function [Plasmodium vivax]|uniref:Uncharacterized protein n=6 Tax=Plasmodium vivax TaxID=5855 RepID=A5KBS7_PLAVS|nr:hypothetical protein, conserved [Plasmodium vivax]KMZ82201.1 hypothetical protein PVIIG_03455 [Plasmodium vivax India VII]KMZ88326.1 hypothetical protein PVBG_04525 [Plasmodium vivax Brazil I]KMZ94691.1 hypothetical protein PVMG_02580 [Plasmodium vivax Mauritania I]KNA01501.1 hypothetical protein PVNG_04826 [Plasmodium vivax North Korean]EDL43123.1 hypothetical protein, conserved [Plasmodium vivax]|eukprot:XP_001612850.1 hypothetical protein [Plasmodium vivax Sal-1]